VREFCVVVEGENGAFIFLLAQPEFYIFRVESLMICFPLWSLLFYTAECQGFDVISTLSAGHSSDVHGVQTRDSLKQTWVSITCFCVHE
jgi:hypothetical protein